MALKQVFVTALTDTWTTASDGDPVGSVRWELDDTYGWCCYKCVLYDNGDAVAAIVGMAAYYVTDTGPAAHTVSMDRDSGTTIGAGIFMSIIPDAGWGWVQIKGRAIGVAALLNGDTADGGAITPVGAAVDGELDVPAADSSHICGWVIDETDYEIFCNFPY